MASKIRPAHVFSSVIPSDERETGIQKKTWPPVFAGVTIISKRDAL
jgi:hypothetical protein